MEAYQYPSKAFHVLSLKTQTWIRNKGETKIFRENNVQIIPMKKWKF